MNWRLNYQFDVINLVSKTPGLPDAPITEPDKTEQNAVTLYTNGYVTTGIINEDTNLL